MKRRLRVGLCCWLALTASLELAGRAGLRFNASESIPRGVYWLSNQPLQRGMFVAACLAEPVASRAVAAGYIGHGRCDDGRSELLKVLAATEGDHVAVTAAGVFINGRLWPRSMGRAADAAGRPLPSAAGLDRRLLEHEALILSHRCAGGFDSRYFGPIDVHRVRAAAIPLLVWDDTAAEGEETP